MRGSSRRWRRAGAALAGVAALLLSAACGGDPDTRTTGAALPAVESAGGGAGAPDAAAPQTEAPQTEAPQALAEGFGAGPTPAPTAKPKRKPKRKAAPDPEDSQLGQVKAKEPVAGCTKPFYEGEALSRAQVKQALTDAAGRTYWPISAPDIEVPAELVKAVAWQESGWQSNIMACDGGVGLMQVMPGTAEMVNNRFGKSYDIDDPGGNAILGANYLAWLVKYFGDIYFEGDYSLPTDGECASHTGPCLINLVILGYNQGPGLLEDLGPLVVPDAKYTRNVRALMTECECLAL